MKYGEIDLTGWWAVEAKVVGNDDPGVNVAIFVLETDAQRFIDDDDTDGAYSYTLEQFV